MDSLQLSELQTFFGANKGELASKKFFVESVDLDPILERALDLSEYIQCTANTGTNDIPSFNISTHISPDFTEAQSSLPQVVLDATALVHEEKYAGEGSVLPAPVVNFLEPNQSPASDASSYYSDDSSLGGNNAMPEFSQLTSPGMDASTTSGFQWPSFNQVKREDFPSFKSEDFGLPSCQMAHSSSTSSHNHMQQQSHHHHQGSVSSSMAEGVPLPYVTSPTTSLPSPTSTIYSASSPGTPGPSAPSGRGRRPHGSSAPYSTKSRRRQVEKGTQEYVEKRARNNVAVRKSRAKAKEKQQQTEHRVKALLDHNDQLQKKVDLLTKELNVLKGLFMNVGASIPDEFLKLIGDS